MFCIQFNNVPTPQSEGDLPDTVDLLTKGSEK